MSDETSQSQRSGRDSVNIQVANYGLSYSEARDVALSVFRENFLRLKEEARQVAEERATELTDRFLTRLSSERPEKLTAATDPDFQATTFSAQRAYARSGASNLADVLVELLVSRAQAETTSTSSLILNEAIEAAGKLSARHLKLLAAILSARYLTKKNLQSRHQLAHYLERILSPWRDAIPAKTPDLPHLTYVGCLIPNPFGHIDIGENLARQYPALFREGFTSDELKLTAPELINKPPEVIRCLSGEKGRFQLGGTNDTENRALLCIAGLSTNTVEKLIKLNNAKSMSPTSTMRAVTEMVPWYSEYVAKLKHDNLLSCGLTSVGIALAHTQFVIETGEQLDFQSWVDA